MVETVERRGHTYVLRNGVESMSFAEQKPSGAWAIMKPCVQCLGTLKETLTMIAADMGTWYTSAQAAARLVELGVYDKPPSAQIVTRLAQVGAFPGAFKLLGKGAVGSGGQWRISETGLVEYVRRMGR